MTNYVGSMRSNYVTVTDVDAFKKVLENTVGEDTAEFIQDKEGRVGFLGLIDGLPVDSEGNLCDADGDDYDFGDYDLFLKTIQPLIVDGEAMIIVETGHEGYRYLHGGVTVMTNTAITSNNLSNIAQAMVNEFNVTATVPEY